MHALKSPMVFAAQRHFWRSHCIFACPQRKHLDNPGMHQRSLTHYFQKFGCHFWCRRNIPAVTNKTEQVTERKDSCIRMKDVVERWESEAKHLIRRCRLKARGKLSQRPDINYFLDLIIVWLECFLHRIHCCRCEKDFAGCWEQLRVSVWSDWHVHIAVLLLIAVEHVESVIMVFDAIIILLLIRLPFEEMIFRSSHKRYLNAEYFYYYGNDDDRFSGSQWMSMHARRPYT